MKLEAKLIHVLVYRSDINGVKDNKNWTYGRVGDIMKVGGAGNKD